MKNFDTDKPYSSGEESVIVDSEGNTMTPEYYKADGFNEEFELCISMFVSQQPVEVKAIIGENGEFLANRFLHTEESGIVARAYYNNHLKTGHPAQEQEAADLPEKEENPVTTSNYDDANDPAAEAEYNKWRDIYTIEARAKSIVGENYSLTDIDSITVNENLGTEKDGDYILLAHLTWNQKNSADLTKRVLAMYSSDFAAQIGKRFSSVTELSIFWTVPYYSSTDTLVKYSYERIDGEMFQSDVMISSILE